jgi:hypothetical protein
VHPIGDVLSSGSAITGKLGWKVIGERIGLIGIAVVAEVPDREDLSLVHGRYDGVEEREVVLALALNEGPWHPLTRYGDAEAAEDLIVLFRVLTVACFLNQVSTSLVLPKERGTLEAGQKEGRENPGATNHEGGYPPILSTAATGITGSTTSAYHAIP